MKNLKKIMAAVLAVMMISAMAVGAISSFAAGSGVTITINRDSSYKGTGDGNIYKWYKVFSASYTANTSTGGGSNSGTPGDVSGTAKSAAYIATAAVAAKLGTWDSTNKTWSKADGNLWFKLTPIASSASGSGYTQYSVEWDNTSTTSETAQAAAKWLYDHQVWEATGDMSFSSGSFSPTATNLDKGYYLINGATGKNLIAATSDITINEKNTYPPIDKKQNDNDDGTSGTYVDSNVDVAVGDVINYQITVHIPATAKVGDKILVYDNKSIGLDYNKDLTFKVDGNNDSEGIVGASDYTGAGKVDGAVWQRLITVSANSIDKDVVFSFSMTVNSSAIVDTGKKNESALKYGPGSGSTPFPYESEPDKVEYKTYFAGIKKIDGDTKESLKGVKFDLKENGTNFTVIKSGSYYIPSTASGSSKEVITDDYGLIRIRGLDKNKTYTLTETATLDGYNLLDRDVTLTLYEDSFVTTTYTPASGNATSGTTYYQKTSTGYNVITVTTGSALPSGTFTASTKSGSSYTGATDDNWGEVENNKGSLLPSTGGIGTTIFYVVGAVLVIGSGIVLVTKKRMGKEEN